MSAKEIVDSVLRLLEIVVSWPAILICAVLVVRKELPGLILKLADRVTKAPGGFEFSALKDQVESISAKVDQLEKATFEPSIALTPALQSHLQSSFDQFQAYLIQLGYQSTAGTVSIVVDANVKDNVYYEGEGGRIVLGEPLARDTDAFFREVSHRALLAHVDYSKLSSDSLAVESGLADYFPCSFNNDPLFGEMSVHLFRDIPEFAKKKAIRILQNERKFSRSRSRPERHDEGEIWGGAFWAMRETLGKDHVDKLLFATWRSMIPVASQKGFKVGFARALAEQAQRLDIGDRSTEVVDIFRRRDLNI